MAKDDIALMPKGVAYIPNKNGYFLSTEYMQEVERAKIVKVNLK